MKYGYIFRFERTSFHFPVSISINTISLPKSTLYTNHQLFLLKLSTAKLRFCHPLFHCLYNKFNSTYKTNDLPKSYLSSEQSEVSVGFSCVCLSVYLTLTATRLWRFSRNLESKYPVQRRSDVCVHITIY